MARTVEEGEDGFWRISGEPESEYYRTEEIATRVAAQLDAGDTEGEEGQDARILAADDSYILTYVQGEDSSGGTQELDCAGAVVGDVVASWLRLDATGGSNKGTFANATDLTTAMFVSPVTTNAKLNQLAGVADQSAFQFIVLLKRTPTS